MSLAHRLAPKRNGKFHGFTPILQCPPDTGAGANLGPDCQILQGFVYKPLRTKLMTSSSTGTALIQPFLHAPNPMGFVEVATVNA